MTIADIDRRCLLTVAIPAKNEEATIERCLAAFAGQRDLDGNALDPRSFEIVVLANDCVDATAALAENVGRRLGISLCVVSRALPKAATHVGTARRLALDLAVERQRTVSGNAGIVASTDADSAVDPFWVAQTLHEMRGVDAVAGHVEIDDDERMRMDVPLRRLYESERSYRSVLGEMEAYVDPRPFDPPSRHDSLVGTSFAVSVGVYRAAGGLPPLPQLEDVAFARALRRVDARIRHSYAVCVATSGRSQARVEGGFGSFIGDLRARSRRRDTIVVESARRSIARARARAILRGFWSSPTQPERLDEAIELFEMQREELASLIDPSAPFGESLDRIDASSPPFESLPNEPVENAIRTLRAMLPYAVASAADLTSAVSRAD